MFVGRDVERGVVLLDVRNGGAVVTGDPERLFEPFCRGGSGREDGAGLGLAIVRGRRRAWWVGRGCCACGRRT